ncbi:hypothetical protein A2U01_0040347, partial [Trifolium medium]|nr:hypothetical protein [Trifolium medium]
GTQPSFDASISFSANNNHRLPFVYCRRSAPPPEDGGSSLACSTICRSSLPSRI